MTTKINVFSENSKISEHYAPLLVKGIHSSGISAVVKIENIACSKEAILTDFNKTDAMNFDQDALKADVYVFPTIGALSIFEKHFFSTISSHELPLKGKKWCVLISDKTTFDGPSPTKTHTIDHQIVDKLSSHGFDEPIVLTLNSSNDESIEEAGKDIGNALIEQ
ncbi:hypothetical protein BDF14DRAFT_841579 [Spinellus fusiger]|nr:hypothetical protein BDF14DRAFT_841579 [Spinellus fusiger]